ncbi:MAG: flagellar hook-basal body complex protein [Firmicutes bacterium]|nr:flagellar hook-basal body complex protein [Bacillota bacterium]
MVRGLYTAAAGMMAKQVQSDVISHNLANAGTPGYRRDEVALRSFPQMLLVRCRDRVRGELGAGLQAPPRIGTLGTGSVVDAVATSYRPGIWQETGNPLDLALRGNVYFAVRDAGGQTFYTRNGSFVLDGTGRLVTTANLAVLGERNGQLEEIYVSDGKLEVGPDGSLRGAVNAAGQEIPRLALVAGPPGGAGAGWRKVGNSLFQGEPQPVAGVDYEVKQGFREGSNVNPVEEMASLIAVMRAYEANQKVVQAIDSTLEKVVNEVGRVR